ncbi:MAG: mucoidy inhibitor MuiA family protein [Nitrospinota bacterium]
MKYSQTVVTGFLFFFISTFGFFNLDAQAAESSETFFGKINKVKLYSDRAEIYREINLSTPNNNIRIGPFPEKLVPNSLRILSNENSSVVVTNIQLERVFESKFISQPIQKQNNLVKNIQYQINELKDSLSVYEDQIKFIESIQGTVTREGTPPGLEYWNSVLNFKSTKGKTTREQRRKLILQIEGEQDRLENETKKLNKMMADSKKGHYVANLDIQASGTNQQRLGFSYQIRNAGWRPTYHLQANTNTKKITLSYFGEIDQNTGEDWENVSLELSTGQPSRGTQPPKLYPWVVDFPKPMMLKSRSGAAAMDSMVMEESNNFSAAMPKTQVVQSGTSYTFQIPKSQTIPAGTRKFRALIVKEILESEIAYTVTPKISQRVFLNAKLKNTSNFHLLPRQSDIYLDGSFTGRHWMKNTAPGKELELGLGTDDSIHVERKLIKKDDGGEGFFGQDERARYIFEIKLNNFKKQPIKLTLKDQLPLPYHEDIEVKINRIDPKADKKDKQNILTWVLELDPGEKKTVHLDFQVEYPEGKNVSGL